jgi:hypothetical protein
VSVSADSPLALQMTMSGHRVDPARQFRMAIGESRQSEGIPETPAVAATEPAPSGDTASGLLMEVKAQPAAGGMRVVVHRLAARQAALMIQADTLLQCWTALPHKIQAHIETKSRSLSASAEVDLQGTANGEVVGRLAFAGVRVRALGSSSMILCLDDPAGTTKINTPLPLGPGTVIGIDRLQALPLTAGARLPR